MKRADLISKYFQRKHLLIPSHTMYRDHITGLFHWMVQADDVKNDITSKSLKLAKNATATIQAKQNGIIAGIEEITYLLQQEHSTVYPKIKDGTFVKQGDIIIQIIGNAADLVGYERTILNILGRMSGIATATFNVTTAVRQNIAVAATRKTPWMFLDKKAVAVGGGVTHRLNLADWPLIKDTYLLILKQELQTKSIIYVIEEAVKRMMQSPVDFFEIEVETVEQARAALITFMRYSSVQKTMAILLDNFQQKSALQFVSEIRKSPVYPRILIEISGGISKNNISSWIKIPVDIISLGALTHSAPAFDLSMSIV